MSRPVGTPVRSVTVANVDAIRLVGQIGFQWAAWKSKRVGSCGMSAKSVVTAFGYYASERKGGMC